MDERELGDPGRHESCYHLQGETSWSTAVLEISGRPVIRDD